MGKSYSYKCQSCGFKQSFNLGYGFFIHSQKVEDYLQIKKRLLHYKTHEKIKKLAQSEKNLKLRASFQVYICPDCDILYEKTKIEVSNSSMKLHQSRFRCTHCHSRLKLTNIHRLSSASCPACKKDTFRRDLTHHDLWDNFFPLPSKMRNSIFKIFKRNHSKA